jgi:CHASE3 domain sensor protein
MYKNMSIKQKLFSGFGVLVFLFLIYSLFQITKVNNLGDLQHESANRGNDAVKVTEMVADLSDLYAISADMIINGYTLESKKDFDDMKKEILEDIKVLEKIVDTDQEAKWLKEYENNVLKYTNIIKDIIVILLNCCNQE